MRISRDAERDADDVGLTDDAKAVIEAAIHHARLRPANVDVGDLLVALATAECPARSVLAENGIDAAVLGGEVGSLPR